MEYRRNHYVPASHLACFTRERDRHGVLGVFDLESCKTRESSPDNEGTKNDLYLIQGPDPRRIEKMFGVIEGEQVDMVREIERTRRLPDAPDAMGCISWRLSVIAEALQTRRTLLRQLGVKL